MFIVGAGLSGAIAGALDRSARLMEAASAPPTSNHRAVLRFRSDKIGQALNIPFRRVRVMKAIECHGELRLAPTPRDANVYARKVTGMIQSRSIGDLAPVERFIAPENFHEQLLDMCGGRVYYSTALTADSLRELSPRFISTIPLNLLCSVLSIEPPNLLRAPIHVTRYDVAECDAFQTLYHTDPTTPLYRSSLTGSLLIIESTAELDAADINSVLRGFALSPQQVQARDEGRQHYGKITPLADATRKALLHRLTTEHGIFSLGRFATWRNILLDDVYDDFQKIRAMMALDNYDLKRLNI